MLFSLTNTLASFQEYINKIPAEKLGIFVIIYQDDILIYTNSDGDSYVVAIRWVLEYNRLNLVTTTRLRGGMLSVNGRSHVLRHVLRHVTQRIMKSRKGAQLRELRWLR